MHPNHSITNSFIGISMDLWIDTLKYPITISLYMNDLYSPMCSSNTFIDLFVHLNL
jgi:hypothetical protein